MRKERNVWLKAIVRVTVINNAIGNCKYVYKNNANIFSINKLYLL